jgi:nucleoside 2-deoxyribosyltransferase
MKTDLKIYIAGPISGEGKNGVIDYFDDMAIRLEKMGFQVFQPMTCKGYFRTEKNERFESHDYKAFPPSTDRAITRRDSWMVSLCDIFWLNVLRGKPDYASIGGVSELSFAWLQHKHTILTIPPVEVPNVHRHAFVLEMSDIIYHTEEDTLDYLGQLIRMRS